MAKIQFKAKIQSVCYAGESEPAYAYVQIPTLSRSHCNMAEFRSHPKYGGLANSDLFPGILKGIRRKIGGDSGILRLDRLPHNVTIDDSGFLAIVTVEA